MKFPGKRKSKHYFPVEDKGRVPLDFDFYQKGKAFVLGIGQPLVDIEICIDEQMLNELELLKGQSHVLDEKRAEDLYQKMRAEDRIRGEYAGGAIGNTLHNYSVLADDQSVLLGSISKRITVGDYAFKYVCNTSTKVDLSYLQPCEGRMGRAMCFITPDGERTFAISKGVSSCLEQEFIPSDLVEKASALLITAFTLRDESEPIFESTLKAVRVANKVGIPVVLSLGTSTLVADKKDFLNNFIKNHVNIVAMNNCEAKHLTGIDDPLLSAEKILDIADMLLLTVGERGLYIGAHVEKELARRTKHELHTKSIVSYNKYEYSRAMLKSICEEPMKIYSHINPYMGGPGLIKNTNGAGDAALSALLHDITANSYHGVIIPNSPKHMATFLTYSSISQICKYANRVSYEVLSQNSPRLIKGLPERESCLEQAYWDM